MKNQHDTRKIEVDRYGDEAKSKIISSSVGSMITTLNVAPLEVVRVFQQAAGIYPPTNILNFMAEPCSNGFLGSTMKF